MLKASIGLALALPGAAGHLRERLKSAPKDSNERQALEKLIAKVAPTDSDVRHLIAEAAEYRDDPDYSPIGLDFKPNPKQKEALASVLRLSKKTAPALKDIYLSSYDWGISHVSARALAQKDPVMLAKATIIQLRNYNQFYKEMISGPADIKKLLYHYGVPAAAGLLALRPIKGNAEVDYTFMQTLSCLDQQFAQYATAALKERLERDKFVAALFSFLALKTSYSMYEVDVYKKALLSYPDSSAAIADNLELLLKAAGGNPAKVPWIHKVIALSCLIENGKPAARQTVEKYKGDPGGYTYVEYRLDADGKRQDEHLTRKRFADLANETLRALASRK
jgi:hypothetical protein